MQILSIRLKNIKCHRDAELTFAPGINVLSGPNGIGKSTVFEAIGYALFGVDARDFVTNVDRFLAIGAKKGEVEVTFSTGNGESWRVTRTVGGATRWLLAHKRGDAFEVEEHAAGSDEMEQRLRTLMGLDNGRPLAEQFKLVIGPFQNEFLGPFVIRQATRRQEAFDEILGIDAWRKTFKGTGTLLTAVQERIKLLSAEIDIRQEQVTPLPEREKMLVDINSRQLLGQEELASHVKNLHDCTELLQVLDVRKEMLDKAENEVRETMAHLESGREHIASQKQLVSQSEEAARVVAESRPGKEAYELSEKLLKELREKEKLRRAVELEVIALEKEGARLSEAVELEQRELARNRAQLSLEEQGLKDARKALRISPELLEKSQSCPGLRQELERAKGERSLLDGRREGLDEGQEKLAAGLCPFFSEPCQNLAGTVPTELFNKRFVTLAEQMALLDKTILKLGLEVAAAEKAEQELLAVKIRGEELDKQELALADRRLRDQERSTALEQLKIRQGEANVRALQRRGDLGQFGPLDAEISRMEQERSVHQVAKDVFQANEQAAAELEGRQVTLGKYQKRLDELQQLLASRQVTLEQLRLVWQPERHLEARQQKDKLVAEVATRREQLESLAKERLRLEAEIGQLKQLQEEIARNCAEKTVYEEKEKLVKFLRNSVFKNVSARLSERFREEISQRGDRIYRIIAESDEELVWSDGYQVTLRDLHDGVIRERSDDQLSGGQMMSAVVSLRLALLQTIGARVAFFDEPTSNLDVSRRENLAHAFRAIDVGREEVLEHWYDQLFLVSHDVSFTEITDQVVHLGATGSN
jgi:exonuclease SbcC